MGLAVVGDDLDGLRLVDHMVVGHSIAVGRNEEAGALSRDELSPLRSARPIAEETVGQAEIAKEALERRALRNGSPLPVEAHGPRGFALDAHRNDRRLHFVDDVGKPDRPRDLGGLRGRFSPALSDAEPGWRRHHRRRRSPASSRRQHRRRSRCAHSLREAMPSPFRSLPCSLAGVTLGQNAKRCITEKWHRTLKIGNVGGMCSDERRLSCSRAD